MKELNFQRHSTTTKTSSTNICATFMGFLHNFVPSNPCQISRRTKSTSSDVRWPMLNAKLPAGDGKPYVDPPQFLTVTKKSWNKFPYKQFQSRDVPKKITFSKSMGKTTLLVNIKRSFSGSEAQTQELNHPQLSRLGPEGFKANDCPTSWWFWTNRKPWKIWVKLEIFPEGRGENLKKICETTT